MMNETGTGSTNRILVTRKQIKTIPGLSQAVQAYRETVAGDFEKTGCRWEEASMMLQLDAPKGAQRFHKDHADGEVCSTFIHYCEVDGHSSGFRAVT
jgi:hypothetical protein